MFGARISMFGGLENFVLRYKSVYYEVIADYGNVLALDIMAITKFIIPLAQNNFFKIFLPKACSSSSF